MRGSWGKLGLRAFKDGHSRAKALALQRMCHMGDVNMPTFCQVLGCVWAVLWRRCHLSWAFRETWGLTGTDGGEDSGENSGRRSVCGCTGAGGGVGATAGKVSDVELKGPPLFWGSGGPPRAASTALP